ncbi:MAG: symmetrical bis(5'-nucleosyl)-tetraphosphatase [Burkholderiales bacterium]
MPTYAIGDVQGCYDQLQRLLHALAFDPRRDRLWFVGDLVNRGPKSLQVLRFVKTLGKSAVTVLGNHDLHLLTVAAGIRKAHSGDTLDEILAAPDRDELVAWLRHRKMMHAENGYAMVHGGLLPQWTVAQALTLGEEVETALRGDGHREFLRHMYGNEPARWSDDLTGYDRLRVIVNAMTRLRLCSADGTMEFSHKIGLESLPAGYMPWYDVPHRASRDTALITGHWAALGLMVRTDLLALDTGCVWGRQLTALRLEDRRIFQCECRELAGMAAE